MILLICVRLEVCKRPRGMYRVILILCQNLRGRLQGIGDIVVINRLATTSRWGWSDHEVTKGNAMEMSKLAVLKLVSIVLHALNIDLTDA